MHTDASTFWPAKQADGRVAVVLLLCRQEVSHLVDALEAAEERAKAHEQSRASLTAQVQQLTGLLQKCQATRIVKSEDERRRLCRRSTALSKTLPFGPAHAACVTERDLLAAKFAVQVHISPLIDCQMCCNNQKLL